MERAVSISEARQKPGLRLLLLEGLPSPWGQAAKGIFEIKGIEYTPAHPRPDDPSDALEAWTGQTSFPAAMYEDEEPRTGWAEILLLAERLAPSPALIPADAAQRAVFFGYAHEICGEMGLGWARRLETISQGLAAEQPNPVSRFLAGKYGHRDDSAAEASARVLGVLGALDALLAQHGGEYLLGELTALDVYWATFANLLDPLPDELLPMHPKMRPMFTASDPATRAALTPALLGLRDRMYERHLMTPIEV